MRTRGHTRLQPWIGSMLVAGMIVLDLVVPIILATHYPGYSTLNDTISTLSTRESPIRWWAAFALGVSGAGSVGYAIWAGVELDLAERRTRWFIGGIAAFGVGTIVAAIAPEDLPGVAETASGKIHGIASALGFFAVMMSLAIARWIVDLRPLREAVTGLFMIAVVTFILFLASEEATTGWLAPTGLYQRLNLLAIYGGLFAIAWHLGRRATGRTQNRHVGRP